MGSDHEENYGEGARDSQNTGFLGHIFHDLIDTSVVGIPHPQSSESKSYEAGWHDHEYGSPKREENKSSSVKPSKSRVYSGYDSTSGTLLSFFIKVLVGIIAIYFIGYLIVGRGPFDPPNRRHDNYGGEVGTMRKVNTRNLNMRAGPGTNYPVIQNFPQHSRIVSYGQTQIVDGTEWTPASTPDGRTRGWVSRKYLSP